MAIRLGGGCRWPSIKCAFETDDCHAAEGTYCITESQVALCGMLRSRKPALGHHRQYVNQSDDL